MRSEGRLNLKLVKKWTAINPYNGLAITFGVYEDSRGNKIKKAIEIARVPRTELTSQSKKVKFRWIRALARALGTEEDVLLKAYFEGRLVSLSSTPNKLAFACDAYLRPNDLKDVLKIYEILISNTERVLIYHPMSSADVRSMKQKSSRKRDLKQRLIERYGSLLRSLGIEPVTIDANPNQSINAKVIDVMWNCGVGVTPSGLWIFHSMESSKSDVIKEILRKGMRIAILKDTKYMEEDERLICLPLQMRDAIELMRIAITTTETSKLLMAPLELPLYMEELLDSLKEKSFRY
ncbi:hypothetical protein EYM_06955 [Ignicoccus islandicus DSM 13165]|uniref:Uncharacterized protein n=1 Tax=Ignicoccus islandicus DSM 13165 TaxID=940295 RepID=A0A0U2U9Q8_9CREN|nr:hypothetical protein [Ignicoccus islandicus]ALU12740.1 hypothetical protein EYM_06955 [Ignicoccus islandicus DSM 13165]